jgi:hypothetical protein
MSAHITSEAARLIRVICRDGGFTDETEALTEALRAYRRRQELIAENEGVAELDRGEGLPADVVLAQLQAKAEKLAAGQNVQ